MANNIVATWGFKRKLPEPFEDYTDHAIFDDIASKYCTQPRKKSTLHGKRFKIKLEQFRQNLLLSGDYDATGNYKQAVKKTAV